ncbi:hypothetical protein GCM10007937_42440 [Mesorhizobium albiziae]|nr:hypothetical protein GCM10007937_42440 [Mesorhizobium albiziae]
MAHLDLQRGRRICLVSGSGKADLYGRHEALFGLAAVEPGADRQLLRDKLAKAVLWHGTHWSYNKPKRMTRYGTELQTLTSADKTLDAAKSASINPTPDPMILTL